MCTEVVLVSLTDYSHKHIAIATKPPAGWKPASLPEFGVRLSNSVGQRTPELANSGAFLVLVLTLLPHPHKLLQKKAVAQGGEKASSTLRSSRAVPHPSTNRALRRLTSEFGRDPVHSTRYGRWRHPMFAIPFSGRNWAATCLPLIQKKPPEFEPQL